MKIGLSLKIDVTKIDKARLFKGEKGTYLDLTAFVDIDQKDQYDNNGFISQTVSKDEKAQGIQTPILGNTRVFYNDSQSQPGQGANNNHQQAATSQAPAGFDDFDDDIPF